MKNQLLLWELLVRNLKCCFSPNRMKKGLGRKLLEEAIKNYSVNELVVNEQNPQAKGFYEHLGFKVYKRNPIDEQGNQYPILFMHLG